MAGWTCADRNLIQWDGDIKAKKFYGDGSQLTGISAGVDGTGSAGKIAYWSDADTITYNSNFSFDGTNMVVPNNCDIRNATNSTTGINLASSEGYNALTVDTTNLYTGIGGTPTAKLTVFKDTSNYYTESAASILIRNNASSGQSTIWFDQSGTPKAKIRSDYVGNLNIGAASGVMYFFPGIDYYDGTTTKTQMIEFNGNSGNPNLKVLDQSSYGAIMGVRSNQPFIYSTTGTLNVQDTSGNLSNLTGDLITGNTINAVSGYQSNGTAGVSGSCYVGSGYNSCYYDSDGDGTNDSWGYVLTGIYQLDFSNGIITYFA